MKALTFLTLLLTFVSVSACANKPSTQETARFIVAFNDAETHQQALNNKPAIIYQWKELTNAHIEFIRTLSGHSWVVAVTASSKEGFIQKLGALPNIKYVEEDQVIQISPIERPSAPGIRIH